MEPASAKGRPVRTALRLRLDEMRMAGAEVVVFMVVGVEFFNWKERFSIFGDSGSGGLLGRCGDGSGGVAGDSGGDGRKIQTRAMQSTLGQGTGGNLKIRLGDRSGIKMRGMRIGNRIPGF